MTCRWCHGEAEAANLCRPCQRQLASIYWGSGGQTLADFSKSISGAGRSAGDSPARPAMGQSASSLRVSAEAAST